MSAVFAIFAAVLCLAAPALAKSPPTPKAPWAYTDGNLTRFQNEVFFLTGYLNPIPDLNTSDWMDPASPFFPEAVPVDTGAVAYELDFSNSLALATDDPSTFTIGLNGSTLYVPTVFPASGNITDGTGQGQGTVLQWTQYNTTTITVPAGTRAFAFTFFTQPSYYDTKHDNTYITWTITTASNAKISFDRVYTWDLSTHFYGFLQDSSYLPDALNTVTATVKKGYTTSGLVFANFLISGY